MDYSPKTGVLELLSPPKGFSPWHGGPTLMGALRGVDNEQAAWKPAPQRHSIWELSLHIAYWNYRACRYMNPENKTGFERSPANWPVIEDSSQTAWEKDKRLIKQQHNKLADDIANFPAERLNQYFLESKKWSFRQLLEGVAAHDTYHIGQIQLMKRLYKELH